MTDFFPINPSLSSLCLSRIELEMATESAEDVRWYHRIMDDEETVKMEKEEKKEIIFWSFYSVFNPFGVFALVDSIRRKKKRAKNRKNGVVPGLKEVTTDPASPNNNNLQKLDINN
ncbi:hypothetical protein DFA_00505 [Cavenderia fasciculata]|uniref:Transmembrane protein n=1 Tax=Cavenderia fasciculata TaxID=261658 RepID=F4PS98_CACFS|nr:uncharacterized protein DFA_00505 [Cavenderia fasciculata]EGG20644.1 hypothetical protein DFA_00505 [Cavenderia fasciculata]|eukprot:XP_004358494.1 hypothetical protein DFA_00505 [Cavenderia fasciculata]